MHTLAIMVVSEGNESDSFPFTSSCSERSLTEKGGASPEITEGEGDEGADYVAKGDTMEISSGNRPYRGRPIKIRVRVDRSDELREILQVLLFQFVAIMLGMIVVSLTFIRKS